MSSITQLHFEEPTGLDLNKMDISRTAQYFICGYDYLTFIYGGMTYGSINDKISEHIQNHYPEQSNTRWEYKHVTKYSLTGNSTNDEENILKLQKYFSKQLSILYKKCVNDKYNDTNEYILTNEINPTSNEVNFYVYYKMFNPNEYSYLY